MSKPVLKLPWACLVLFLLTSALAAPVSADEVRDPFDFVCGRKPEKSDARERERAAQEFVDVARGDYAATRGRKELTDRNDPLVALRRELAQVQGKQLRLDSLEAIRKALPAVQGLAEAM